MSHSYETMIKIPEIALSGRAHSAAWIKPDGEFIPLMPGEHHAAVASDFPEMPSDDENASKYPSTYAIARMGYVKVSNPFMCSWDGRGRRGDVRMETMSDFMSQFVVRVNKTQRNPLPWDIDVHNLIDVKVYVTTVTDPNVYARTERDDSSVGDFVDRYGSRETIDFLYGNLLGESFIRRCRRAESRILESRRDLNENGTPLNSDRLYRMIVRELRSAAVGR